jgi:predicted transcriptional regulator of viral defense system
VDTPIKPADLSDWLIAHGQHFATTDEIAELVGVAPGSVRQSLRRSTAANKIVSVTNGAWVPVPPEYRAAGAPPPAHFIHQLMDFLGHPYYVGFLSAAAIHGASHQAVMVFQVATPAVLRDRQIGAGQMRFIRRSAAPRRSVVDHLVPTGRIKVSTPAVTLLDLVESPSHGAGLSNVANVIAQFVEDEIVDPAVLATEAIHYPTAVAQRAGFLTESMADLVGTSLDLRELEQLIQRAESVPLAPHRSDDGDRNNRWGVVVNSDIEPDL